MLYWIAAVFFFFAVAGVNLVSNPTAWGLLALALGMALGGPSWGFWRRKE